MNVDLDRWIGHHFPWAAEGSGDRIRTLLFELEIWNKHTNLTGLAVNQWLDKIVAESAALVPLIENGSGKSMTGYWMDMGTGAGIPGLIIAAMCPDQKICLVDSRRKKMDFVRYAALKMHLSTVQIIHERLENILLSLPNLARNGSVFFSRALADIPDLAGYADPLAATGAVLISPRGGSELEKELDCCPKSGRNWSGRIIRVPVPGFDRWIKCARLVLENVRDAEGISKL